MRTVRVGKDRIYEVPTTYAEGEEMISRAMRYYDGQRGGNMGLLSVCGLVAFGLFCDQELTADPTQALAYLIQRLCIRKGAGVER
jgi:hypothetical protein